MHIVRLRSPLTRIATNPPANVSATIIIMALNALLIAPITRVHIMVLALLRQVLVFVRLLIMELHATYFAIVP
jgi:hypothetical protein